MPPMQGVRTRKREEQAGRGQSRGSKWGMVTVMAPLPFSFVLTLLGLPFPAWLSDDLHYCAWCSPPLSPRPAWSSLSAQQDSEHAITETHMSTQRENCTDLNPKSLV